MLIIFIVRNLNSSISIPGGPASKSHKPETRTVITNQEPGERENAIVESYVFDLLRNEELLIYV